MEILLESLRQPYIWSSLIVVLVLCILAIIIGQKVKKLKVGEKPGLIIAVVISFVSFINNYTKQNVGEQWKFVAPHILMLSIFLFVLNISGLFLLDTPTKYTTITVGFAIWAFGIIQVTGIRSKKVRHLGTLVGPLKPMSPLMIPLNILSDVTPLLSMTLRIFGNIASGALLMSLIYGLLSWGSIFVAPPLHLIFDIGFGLIQTVVFIVLTLVFTANKLDEKEFEKNII